jgi:hypothetical protein
MTTTNAPTAAALGAAERINEEYPNRYRTEYVSSVIAAIIDAETGLPDLIKACLAAKKYLEPDLVEPGRTVFWNLVAAIKRVQEGEKP